MTSSKANPLTIPKARSAKAMELKANKLQYMKPSSFKLVYRPTGKVMR